MRLLDIINALLEKAAPQAGNVGVILKAIASKYPDAAEQLGPIIAVLDAPIDTAKLGASVIAELPRIVRLDFDPRKHSGDAV